MSLLALADVACFFDTASGRVRAVDGVSFEIRPGETYALVGESGCGKSTLAKLILGLVPLSAGRIEFDGGDVATFDRGERRRFRSRVQAVFQDPYSSLNPRLKISSILTEPLKANGVRGAQADSRAREVLELVGLAGRSMDLYPHEFSGGQRQRVAIARALTLNPDLIILDEPISALDVSIRAQILNLLQDIQSELGLTFLLIAHDLALVEHASDRVGVMYLGQIVEMGDTESLFAGPQHPYTKALLAAVPRPDPTIARGEGLVKGDVASAIKPPSGCRFHPRCPVAVPACEANEQSLRPIAEDRIVACDRV